ncbi:MAG: DUF6600 domain-containing protein [Candidatus Binatia bacterium]
MISLAAKKMSLRSLAALMAFLMLFVNAPLAAPAQEFQDYDDDDDVDQTVARISYISGPVSYGRGDDPDEWDPAVTNVPFTLGDRIYSSTEGRAELQLPGGNFVRIGRQSYLNALTLTDDTKQFYLGNGAVTLVIRRLDPDEIFEVDTPNVAVTFDTPGRYRVEVDDDGNTRVIVRRGTATVAADGREVTVEQAEMRIYGVDSPRYETIGLRAADAFDRWVDEREGRYERAYRDADRYANERVVGLEDLAEHGRWEEIPEYGYAWTPTRVAAGWQPFTVGHWFWQDPWGWTWISEEPWGWAPSHYGRWTHHRSRWYWVPVERRVRVVRYVPAVVEFVHVRDHIGWFPLHPRDRFVPWWSRRARVVEEVTYVNRTRVVVVDEQTFVSARRVTTRIVRDTTIIREVTTIRVRERRLPIPRRESIRVAFEEGQRRRVERPPERILSRPVVVRTAPVPPPPRFEEKLRVIRERQGKPLAPEEMASLGAKELKQRGVRIRPAAAGRGEFAPKSPSASVPPPRPVTPPKGRKLATPDEPVLTSFPQRRERQQQEKQERQVQEQRRKEQRDEQPSKGQQKQQEQQRKEQPGEEQRRQKEEKTPQQKKDQPRGEDRQRLDQERDKQDQGRKQKLEEQQKQKQENQLQQQQQKEQQKRDAEQRREQERKQQQDERERQKQLQEQQKKDQQLRQQQQREEQKQREQERLKQQEQERQQQLQERERQKKLQEQQRQQQQSQKEQRRLEQERQRLERQQQPQEEQARQKQLQEQRRLQKQREEQKRRQEQGGETPAPTGPTTPPPPR